MIRCCFTSSISINRAFSELKMGYASALAWVLFLIVLILTVIQFRFAQRWVFYEGGDEGRVV